MTDGEGASWGGFAVDRILEHALRRSGLSITQLALTAGVSRGAIHGYQRGTTSPTARVLDQLLAACGLQGRVSLEPLMADLDERVAALEGPLPSFEEHSWPALVASLDDQPGARDGRIGGPAPRRGPVTWAFDGATALVLHGLSAEPAGLQAMDIVVVLDEALRFWMYAVLLRGEHPEQGLVMDWLDAEPERIVGALGGAHPRYCVLGFVRVRVVTAAPEAMRVVVPRHERPVPVVTVDEVERTNPVYGEVLARWRARRGLS